MTVICTVCSSHSVSELFLSCNRHGRHILDEKETFSFYRCYSCRAVFPCVPVVDDAFYSRYYPADYYNTSGAEGAITRILNSHAVHQKTDFILSHLDSGKRPVSLLDVGCGSCAFIKRLDRRKFSPAGTDINTGAGEICRKSGIEFISGDALTADFGSRRYDVVTLWHVLEHMRNPADVLKRLAGLLTETGIIVVAVPDTASLGFRTGRDIWFHADAPRHLFLPCAETMNYISGSAGLCIADSAYEFYDYPLDLFWSVRNSLKRLYIYPFYPIFKMFSNETRTYVLKRK